MPTLLEHVRRNMFLHAYALEGKWEVLKPELTAFAAEVLSMPLTGAHPDARLLEFETFGIDESRSLDLQARRKGSLSDEKLFVLAVQSVTHEAQNALLKLLEDAPHGLHVILSVPSFSMLLPTLRSRLFLLPAMFKKGVRDKKVAVAFMEASPKDRLDILAPLIEAKDKREIGAFLDALEVYCAEELSAKGRGRARGCTEIVRARRCMGDRSSSLKLLLENLALAL